MKANAPRAPVAAELDKHVLVFLFGQFHGIFQVGTDVLVLIVWLYWCLGKTSDK